MPVSDVVSIIAVVVAALSAGFSFHFSRISKKHANESLNHMREQYRLQHGQRMNQLIDAACEKFHSAGTPFHYISSIPDIDEAMKSEIWHQAHVRHKGRPPKWPYSEQAKKLKKDNDAR